MKNQIDFRGNAESITITPRDLVLSTGQSVVILQVSNFELDKFVDLRPWANIFHHGQFHAMPTCKDVPCLEVTTTMYCGYDTIGNSHSQTIITTLEHISFTYPPRSRFNLAKHTKYEPPS